MGNALSGILAEIYLSDSLTPVIDSMPPGSLEFMFIFIDDLFYGVQKEYKDILISRISQATGINLKSSEEDARNSVSYLNMECIRNEAENKLEFKWWQKPESANRILDFHSFHPTHIKINVITEFVMNALQLTSKHFWNETIISVENVLFNSNYPFRLVKRIISNSCKKLGTIEVTSSIGNTDIDIIQVYNTMVPTTIHRNIKPKPTEQLAITNPKIKPAKAVKYLGFPYHPHLKSKFRTLSKNLKIRNVYLTSRMIIKNRKHIYTNLKDKRTSSGIKNAIFKIKCHNCNFEFNCKTNNLDVNRTASHHRNNKSSPPYKHISENGSHKLFIDESTIEIFRNKKDLLLFNER